MATAAPQLAKRYGTDFIDFCRRAVEILCAYPYGVDQDIFLWEYYNGNPPQDAGTRNFQWEEFKRARDFSNEKFNSHEEGWVWIRARHGPLRGQYYYQAVARIADGEPEIIIQYPVSEKLHLEKSREWETRTKSEMRVRVANIDAKRRAAITSGNRALLAEAEQELDEIIVLAPRLAAINFDTGLKVEDLRQIAKSRRLPRVLYNAVKRTLDSYEKSQKEIKALSQLIYAVKQIRAGGRP